MDIDETHDHIKGLAEILFVVGFSISTFIKFKIISGKNDLWRLFMFVLNKTYDSVSCTDDPITLILLGIGTVVVVVAFIYAIYKINKY